MKNFLLLIIFSLINIALQAQNLSLAQLLEIRKKNLANAEEYLVSKGWEFKEAGKADFNEEFSQVFFLYNKVPDQPDHAESYILYAFKNDFDKTKITIQFFKKAKYTEYMNAIKGYGCKLISSEIVDNEMKKIYRGATTTFIIRSTTGENNYGDEIGFWYLSILTNDDYDS
ncbi:hypothetical protein [Epilithonimonas zeae]|uniref:hypothetical protein n=1 Tax=Epilithonimonas zeae TaxID=1416779 RepID=UPI00200EFA7E|nr:hypothetical protein [Epilithonimonas zeae]UQB69150.1 hypothetical protein KI430_01530 [Epilithonimonas zeae]